MQVGGGHDGGSKPFRRSRMHRQTSMMPTLSLRVVFTAESSPSMLYCSSASCPSSDEVKLTPSSPSSDKSLSRSVATFWSRARLLCVTTSPARKSSGTSLQCNQGLNKLVGSRILANRGQARCDPMAPRPAHLLPCFESTDGLECKHPIVLVGPMAKREGVCVDKFQLILNQHAR